MDSQGCDLHDIADVKQVEPLTLVEVAKENFHIQWLAICDRILKLSFDFLILLLLLQILAISQIYLLVLDHFGLYLFDNWIDPQSSALKHGDGVVIVDQISLRASLADGYTSISSFDPLLLFVDILLPFLGLNCAEYVHLAESKEVINEIL